MEDSGLGKVEKMGLEMILQSTIKVYIHFTEWDEGCYPSEAPISVCRMWVRRKTESCGTARERPCKASSFVFPFTPVTAYVFLSLQIPFENR